MQKAHFCARPIAEMGGNMPPLACFTESAAISGANRAALDY
jgi:hypothetical protein